MSMHQLAKKHKTHQLQQLWFSAILPLRLTVIIFDSLGSVNVVACQSNFRESDVVTVSVTASEAIAQPTVNSVMSEKVTKEQSVAESEHRQQVRLHELQVIRNGYAPNYGETV